MSACTKSIQDLKGHADALPLSGLLAWKSCSSNSFHRNGVIETTTDTILRDVVSLLLKNNISSCPVRKAEFKDIPGGNFEEVYAGVIDLLDIVAFVLDIVKTTQNWGKGFEAVLEAVVQFAEHTVQNVLDASPAISFQSLPTTATIGDAIRLLGKDRFHRVIVVNPETRALQDVVSQSTMTAYLESAGHTDPIIQAFAKLSLSSIGLGTQHKMVTIPVTHKAVDAFHLIQKYRVTGIPVVNADGKLVGNVSARDIRSMVGSPDRFDRLFSSLSEFLIDIQIDREAEAPVVVPAHASDAGHSFGSAAASNLSLASPFARVPSFSHGESASSSGFATGSGHSPRGGCRSAHTQGHSHSQTHTQTQTNTANAGDASASASTTASTSASGSETAGSSGVWALPRAITLSSNDSFGKALETLVKRGVHRAYIVEEHGKPSGVVTLTDVMRAFVEGGAPAARRGSSASLEPTSESAPAQTV